TAAYLPGQAQVVTATYGAKVARLRRWDVSPGQDPRPESQLAFREGMDFFPRALALVSARSDGRMDHAAVVSAVQKVPNRVYEYYLQLFELAGADAGAVKAERFLMRGSPKQPVLAATPKGRYLAVAGCIGDEILVYSTKELLDPGNPSPQRLRSL